MQASVFFFFFIVVWRGGCTDWAWLFCLSKGKWEHNCLSSTQCTLQKGEKPREGRLAPRGLTFQSVKTSMRNKGEKVKDCPTRIIFYSGPCIFARVYFLGETSQFFSFLLNKRSYKGTAQLRSTFKPKTFPVEWNLFSISIYFFPK